MTYADFSGVVHSAGGRTCRNEEAVADAVVFIVKVATMVDCSALYQSPDRLENGTWRICWKGDEPFSKYLQDLFPTQKHPVWVSSRSRSKGERLDPFIAEGALLPRQLLLETLDSTQHILFPLHDAKAKKLLDSLIRDDKYKFDVETGRFEFGALRSAGEENIPYVYLADRPDELYQEFHNPRPRSWLDEQLQRRSGARYMMLATLIGVTFAVLLGIVGLALSALQAWIAYQVIPGP
ncbi:hypothetical protein GGS20DRAFT_593591 [Poronia punctata]|nr:hypothetical protein GGS20DRAFT_593591 [Poronia punctata]